MQNSHGCCLSFYAIFFLLIWHISNRIFQVENGRKIKEKKTIFAKGIRALFAIWSRKENSSFFYYNEKMER